MAQQKRTRQQQKTVLAKPNTNRVDAVISSTSKRQRKASQTDNDKSSKSKKKADINTSDQVIDASSLAPATIVIPHPKGAPFPDAITPDALQFMADLRENNNRDFFRVQQDRWKKVRTDFMDFISVLITQLHEADPSIMIEEARDAIYRQHRDLRFTNDLRPYKTYLSASFSRGGKKSPFAGYHISISPGNGTHVAAGIWQPDSAILTRVRQGMTENGVLLREALSLKTVQDIFGKSGLDVLSQEDMLKTAPKGIRRDHPDIDLLRYKSLVVSKTFNDVDVVSQGFLGDVLDAYEALVPFITVINSWTG